MLLSNATMETMDTSMTPEKEGPDIAVGGQYRIHDSSQCSDAGENQHEMSGAGLLEFINVGQYHSHGHTHKDKDIEP